MTTANVSRMAAEVWVAAGVAHDVRTTWLSAEAWVASGPAKELRPTWISAEVWVPSYALPNGNTDLVPLIYPRPPGISINVDWDPTFFSTSAPPAQNGAQITLGVADTPLHKFTLKYNFLRGPLWNGSTEWKTYAGFFLALRANLGRFLFKWDDDYQAVGQPIGTTDGTTTTWTLVRTFGIGPDDVGTEPIGWLDQALGVAFNVYLDGILQAPSGYTLLTTVGALQQLQFNAPPANGHAITVDMSYYYYCRFTDPNITFSKFLKALWSVQRVSIMSCRPYA